MGQGHRAAEQSCDKGWERGIPAQISALDPMGAAVSEKKILVGASFGSGKKERPWLRAAAMLDLGRAAEWWLLRASRSPGVATGPPRIMRAGRGRPRKPLASCCRPPRASGQGPVFPTRLPCELRKQLRAARSVTQPSGAHLLSLCSPLTVCQKRPPDI